MEFEKSEYEIQHFGFSVAQIKLEHRFVVATQIETLAGSFAESLIKKSNVSIPVANTIRSKSTAVKEKIMNAIEDKLAKFDELLEKYFSIPENVLLVEDLRHENPLTESDEEYYAKVVAEKEETFKQNKYLIASLESELKMYEDLLPSLEYEKERMEKVEESFRSNLNFQENPTFKKLDDAYRLKADKENGWEK